jgi:hypothetical protein
MRHRNFNPNILFECANNVSTLRVVTYIIWVQIEDRYEN